MDLEPFYAGPVARFIGLSCHPPRRLVKMADISFVRTVSRYTLYQVLASPLVPCTSFRCSYCGNEEHAQRVGKRFKCHNPACQHQLDADLNAACNITEAVSA